MHPFRSVLLISLFPLCFHVRNNKEANNHIKVIKRQRKKNEEIRYCRALEATVNILFSIRE